MPSMPFIAYCLEGQEEESTLLHASVASSCENIAVYTSNEMDVAVAVHLKVPGQKLLLALEHLVELLARPQVGWPHPPVNVVFGN